MFCVRSWRSNGEVVTKDDLIEKVWARVIVEANNLQAQISGRSDDEVRLGWRVI